ncbi:hypothetical protein SAMN04244576_06389 [Sinorhizobium meliloti]|nr:hypothetical protein SAMN04244576_06389 [Sinorhizobium meliloti]
MHKVWGVSGSVELCAKRVESTESEAAATIAVYCFPLGRMPHLKGVISLVTLCCSTVRGKRISFKDLPKVCRF